MEKRDLIIILIGVFIIFSVLPLFIKPPVFQLTGMGGIVTGTITLIVEGGEKNIDIISPENKTYNFSIGDTYTIDLNVSNTTFDAVRWSNRLMVYAEDSEGEVVNKNVTFFVFVPNSAPIIEGIEPDIYVCEADYLSYFFNVTDADFDTIMSDISPKGPFYVFPILSIGKNLTVFEIFSGTLKM